MNWRQMTKFTGIDLVDLTCGIKLISVAALVNMVVQIGGQLMNQDIRDIVAAIESVV